MQRVRAGESLPAVFLNKHLYWHYQMWRLQLLCYVCSSYSSFSAPTLNLRREAGVMVEKQPLSTFKKHHRCTLKATSTFKISHIPHQAEGSVTFSWVPCARLDTNGSDETGGVVTVGSLGGRGGSSWKKTVLYHNDFMQHSQVTGFILNARNQNGNYKTHHHSRKWL